MAKLPASRVVSVTLSRNDAFPSRTGFGIPLFLTSQEVTGKLDADNLTRAYGSMSEVADDFAAGDDFYEAAEAAFSQNPTPTQIKAGYYDDTTVTTAALMKDALDDILDADNGWYWLVPDLRDSAILDGVVEWTETKRKIAIIDSNDPLMKDSTDATNIAAVHKGDYERTAIFWHDDSATYPAFALAASLGSFDFDKAGSRYTAKFKKLSGIPAVNIGSNALNSVTGYTPGVGQSTATGHLANTKIDVGGQSFVVEGSTLTANVFIDEIHVTDWIIARTEEQALGVFLNNASVPFTDQGMQMIAGAARTVMNQAINAGLIASDLDPETGDYAPAVVITVPSVFDVPESQRKARVAPPVVVRFRYAGAVHYSTINFHMTF